MLIDRTLSHVYVTLTILMMEAYAKYVTTNVKNVLIILLIVIVVPTPQEVQPPIVYATQDTMILESQNVRNVAIDALTVLYLQLHVTHALIL